MYLINSSQIKRSAMESVYISLPWIDETNTPILRQKKWEIKREIELERRKYKEIIYNNNIKRFHIFDRITVPAPVPILFK